MANLLRAEFYKLAHNGSFWMIGLVSFLLGRVLLLDGRQTSHLFYSALYNVPLLSFLTNIWGAIWVGGEFQQGTLYWYVEAGHKRIKVLLAKVVTYQVSCAVVLLLPVLLCGISGENLVEEKVFSALEFGIISVLSLVVTLAMCMPTFFLAIAFRDIGRTLVASMVLFFVSIFWLNSVVAQSAAAILPMGQLRLLCEQPLPAFVPVIWVVDVVGILALFFCTYGIFRRSDLR